MVLIKRLLTQGIRTCTKTSIGQALVERQGLASITICRCLATRTKESTRADFQKVLPIIIDEVVVGNPDLKDLPMIQSWYKKMFEYTMVGGKLTRGILVVDSFYQMTEPSEINEESVFAAQIVGWCTEMLLSSLLVIDDMMDEAKTRRGRPCWYLTNDLGSKATNDGLMIEACIYDTLRKYLSDKPYYMDLVRLFDDMAHKTYLGQAIDMHSYITDGKTDFNKVTLDLVKSIAEYKTAYCTLYLPVVAAMHLAGQGDPKLLDAVRKILLEIGIYFQAQDDFIDCFSDSSVTGKYGTDIEDGKCTWLLATALEKGTPEQVKALKENYGVKDKECVAIVRQIYSEIGVPEAFAAYEAEFQDRVTKAVDQLPSTISKGPFSTILKRLKGRKV